MAASEIPQLVHWMKMMIRVFSQDSQMEPLCSEALYQRVSLAGDKTPSPVPGLPAHSAALLASQDRRPLPGLLQGQGEKEETVPSAAAPTSSLEGCSNPGLLGSQIYPMLSRGSTIRMQDLRLPKRRPIQGKRFQCSGDGCLVAFQSLKELLDHLSVHYKPTQSLEGKIFHCSALGCAETFPTMQDLMGHTRVHCKPNRYFKCENCMSRFQTYRSLFKHLHVCSDNGSRLAGPLEERPVFPTTSGPEKEPPGKLLDQLPKFQSVIQHMKKEALLPGGAEATSALACDSLPAGLPGPLGPVPLPPSAPHPFPLLEPSLYGPAPLARFAGPPHSSVAGPLLPPYMHPSTYPLPQNRFRPYLPGQGLPVSNAVWKKSQGHSSNSRIVWEHTRGRYNCLQCSYSTASREEMTQHTEDHRKNAPPPGRLDGEMDFAVGLPSFHSKMTPEMDTSLFSPL